MTFKPSSPADAEAYADWYARSRGAWIGDREFVLLRRLLDPRPGDSMLDVGCGTGYFTGRFSSAGHGPVVGLDPNIDWLRHARHEVPGPKWVASVAEALPFPDGSFDLTMAVTSLCFVDEERRALLEMARVTRRRLVVGLLNRHSLLWREKGRGPGSCAYRGARWHTPAEARDLWRISASGAFA
jgi:SAM-dependent methyltransferase